VGSVVDGVSLLAPLAADHAGKPPTSFSLADEKRVSSFLLSTAARDPRSDCWLRSLRISWKAAYFVVARRREAGRLVPP
jgi:hypothetical protein